MERLLVTGVDYPLGSNMARALADRCDVMGLYARHQVDSPEVRTARCEAGDLATLERLVRAWEPRWILHCGPLSASSWDPAPSAAAAEDQPRVVAHLAKLAAEASARLTVISSDIVFAGPRMFHEEDSPATSPAPRAAHTLAMERTLESSDALVVRTHAYGWSPTRATAGFAERAFDSLASGIAVAADGRRHATPILATDLADLLWRAFELRLQGLVHLAGAERTSPWGFVSELAASVGLHWPGGRSEARAGAAVEWHDETSLNSKRGRRALEMATPMMREGVDRFVRQAHDGWRDRWRAAGRVSSTHEVAA